ncbi:hypothetical protein A2141_04965 [Candidatus Woesebacteria bacterium RBG_16_40_11]|uniref:Uncharacterized protein n=1 Tax=Candidatus Woesebacteria bacterium RIFCSPHIGHO2_01_FULL_40_22 TaxID=1802499 RepID=A0A1F7YGL0_9BACT|nr:MAG: hypothetical protein A2141_04965 [Candidatus Woesebacteria bacterium RBG_16_40_11]OGM26481.1 MAG: hypothetical protein A2628_03000 [Candidatus Woesebacteria bacterium RIFCSPHIGHO2_01_FULL_40_22]
MVVSGWVDRLLLRIIMGTIQEAKDRIKLALTFQNPDKDRILAINKAREIGRYKLRKGEKVGTAVGIEDRTSAVLTFDSGSVLTAKVNTDDTTSR